MTPSQREEESVRLAPHEVPPPPPARQQRMPRGVPRCIILVGIPCTVILGVLVFASSYDPLREHPGTGTAVRTYYSIESLQVLRERALRTAVFHTASAVLPMAACLWVAA